MATLKASEATMELVQTGKRDFLQALEKKYQDRWQQEKLFETDAPPRPSDPSISVEQVREGQPKWFGNSPYAYMNGSLHAGHAFTLSKIEFNAGYQRMLGKRTLFPIGFHCTGLPIKTAADKLAREIEIFGENFDREAPEEEPEVPSAPAPSADAPPTEKVDKAKKGKVASKSTGLKRQWEIMETMGIARTEIKKFADPWYWTDYYPVVTKEDTTAFGLRVDWRRSFTTTDKNPYYDSFVRWQINKLRKIGKIKFGERYTIYSPKDGQPCMDHDRSEGEALNPQEYTALKLEVVSWSDAASKILKEKIGSKKVFLVAATLRPETMYGQTNCFVGTTIKYGLFQVNDTDVYLCTYRAARNMAYQGVFAKTGEIKQIAEIVGSSVIGTKVKAPFGIYPEVYVLPMDNVLDNKGTGVVTSVPSDSPDDFQTLTDLKKKPEFYKIDPSWVAFEPIPVLSTPTYGEMTAPAIVKQMKIQSQKDVKQLAEAKAIAYKEGFYNGTMSVGEFKDQPVQDAKTKVRASMIQQGLAFAYAEPEGLVVSRSGDECCVALMDQWYLDYGEASWKAQAEELLGQMETYGSETRHAFQSVLDWLNQWACARSYGLGSKLPWDPQFLVESLSDSTIYMAYYTVAHFLQGNVDGHKTGPLGITPDQMTDEVWEYIFCDGPFPEPSPVPREKADKMKWEFEYFYPMDIRSSGKDLIPNHLTFAIYNHAAIFKPKHWPRSFRANGHLTVNGTKMSKSKGNFLTLRQTIDKFGVDVTRMTMADAGDGIEDANFDEKTANASILRLYTLIEWCTEMTKNRGQLRTGEKSYHDRVFEEEIKELINTTQAHYEATNYKDALKTGFYELQMARDWYREVTQDVGMHADLVAYWIRTQVLVITPICPHFSEHIWTTVLEEPKSIQWALWPTPATPVDRAVLESGAYMRSTVKVMRDAEQAVLKGIKKAGAKGKTLAFDPHGKKAARIYYATSFPEWQDKCVQAVQDCYDAKTGAVDDAKVREALAKSGLMKDKRAMPYVQMFKKRIGQFGAAAAFKRSLPFSEATVLQELAPYMKRTLGLEEIEIFSAADASKNPEFAKAIIDNAEPGSPSFEFRNTP